MNAQTLFKKTYGGAGNDLCNAAVQAFDGGFLLAGSTGTNGNGNSDGYLVKIDSTGNYLWSKMYGGLEIETFNSIIETQDSGIVMVGTTNSTGTGGYEIYVVKTDSLGNLLWTKTFGGFDWEFGNSVVETNELLLLIGGETFSFGQGNNDMYIIRTDKNGDSLWTKTYGGKEEEACRKAIELPNGDLAFCGYSSSYGKGKKDMYVITANSLGDTLWTKTFGGSKDDEANDIIHCIDDEFLIVGYSSSFGNGGKDYSVYKIRTDGNLNWNIDYSWVDGEDEFKSVKEFPNGGYAILGSTTSFGGGKTDYHINFTGANSGWALPGKSPTFWDTENELPSEVLILENGGFVLAGSTNSSGSGKYDFFIIKSDTALFPDNTTETIGFNEPVNIIEVSNNKVKIHPNPFKETVYIDIDNNFLKNTIHIYNVLGELIYADNFNSKSNSQLNLGLLETGIYFIKIISDNQIVYSKKVIKIENE